MSKKLNNIIKKLLVNKKIDKLKETESDIKKSLGENFLKKHTKGIYIKNDKIIIETKTIEAKTELNIIKKNFNTKIRFL